MHPPTIYPALHYLCYCVCLSNRLYIMSQNENKWIRIVSLSIYMPASLEASRFRTIYSFIIMLNKLIVFLTPSVSLSSAVDIELFYHARRSEGGSVEAKLNIHATGASFLPV